METYRHDRQMTLLMETLTDHWADRSDFFIGGDMFLYFSEEQTRGRDFRGPDCFLVLDTVWRERKSWVVWQEGMGPDLIIELLSESTAHVDRGEKMRVYQDQLQVQEYYWYDPFSTEFAGFTLEGGVYVPIAVEPDGGRTSPLTGLRLVPWDGAYSPIEATWLRWATRDGILLSTGSERGDAAERERDATKLSRDRVAQERDVAARERDVAARARDLAALERDIATRERDAALRRVAELEARLRDRGEMPEPE